MQALGLLCTTGGRAQAIRDMPHSASPVATQRLNQRCIPGPFSLSANRACKQQPTSTLNIFRPMRPASTYGPPQVLPKLLGLLGVPHRQRESCCSFRPQGKLLHQFSNRSGYQKCWAPCYVACQCGDTASKHGPLQGECIVSSQSTLLIYMSMASFFRYLTYLMITRLSLHQSIDWQESSEVSKGFCLCRAIKSCHK